MLIFEIFVLCFKLFRSTLPQSILCYYNQCLLTRFTTKKIVKSTLLIIERMCVISLLQKSEISTHLLYAEILIISTGYINLNLMSLQTLVIPTRLVEFP